MHGAPKSLNRILKDLSKKANKQDLKASKRSFQLKLQKDAKREQRMERSV